MPVVRGIYNAAKQIFETVLASQSNTFREVVLTEWPRPGMWTVAFVTAQPQGEIATRSVRTRSRSMCRRRPIRPRAISCSCARRDLVTLAMSVEEGIKLVISGGIIAPPDRPLPSSADVEPPRRVAAPPR